MKIVWDEPKRQANIVTHGLDLADAESFDWETALVVPGRTGKGGRPRFRAIGRLGNELVTLVFSPLAHDPAKWNRFADKIMRQFKTLARDRTQNRDPLLLIARYCRGDLRDQPAPGEPGRKEAA